MAAILNGQRFDNGVHGALGGRIVFASGLAHDGGGGGSADQCAAFALCLHVPRTGAEREEDAV